MNMIDITDLSDAELGALLGDEPETFPRGSSDRAKDAIRAWRAGGDEAAAFDFDKLSVKELYCLQEGTGADLGQWIALKLREQVRTATRRAEADYWEGRILARQERQDRDY